MVNLGNIPIGSLVIGWLRPKVLALNMLTVPHRSSELCTPASHPLQRQPAVPYIHTELS